MVSHSTIVFDAWWSKLITKDITKAQEWQKLLMSSLRASRIVDMNFTTSECQINRFYFRVDLLIFHIICVIIIWLNHHFWVSALLRSSLFSTLWHKHFVHSFFFRLKKECLNWVSYFTVYKLHAFGSRN